jgi:anti-sigma regulatory factor (Ser/Thr protein kinase)
VDREAETITYSCAGHPYPLLVLPDGTATFLDDGSRAPIAAELFLGAKRSGQAPLPPGSLIVLYTDGLIERRGESLDAGMARLASLARELLWEPVGAVCDRLIAGLQPASGFADDVAVVVARPRGVSQRSFVDVFPASVGELAPARRRLRAWLESTHADPNLIWDVITGVGEAVNNAIEHGSKFNPQRRIMTEVFASGAGISASVTDGGKWEADSAASRRVGHRGRGMLLMHELADEVITVPSDLGTRVTLRFRAAEAMSAGSSR